MTVSATTNTIAGRISFNMTLLLGPGGLKPGRSNQMQGGHREVDRLDADERDDDAADAVDQQIAPQQRAGADRPIADAPERQRDERYDDQRVEDDGGEDRALRRRQAHDVERLQLRVERDEHRRDDGEVLR